MKKTLLMMTLLTSVSSFAESDLIINCPGTMTKVYGTHMEVTVDNYFDYYTNKSKFQLEENSGVKKIIGERTILLRNNRVVSEDGCQVNEANLHLINGPLKTIDIKNVQNLKSGELYSVLDSYHSLKDGVLMIYVGETKGLMGKEFLTRLKLHVELVAQTMQPHGQLKYYVYSSGDREFALIQWPNKDMMNFAFEKSGSPVWKDADEFLSGILWKEMSYEDIPGQLTKGFIENIMNQVK